MILIKSGAVSLVHEVGNGLCVLINERLVLFEAYVDAAQAAEDKDNTSCFERLSREMRDGLVRSITNSLPREMQRSMVGALPAGAV